MNSWLDIYELSLNSNGFHNIKFYIDTKSGNMIKLSDIYLNKVNKLNIRAYYHMGYKKKINDNLWMFGLFTSNSITNINGFIIKNIELSNNMFSYVNPPIFIRNDLISHYIEIIDDVKKFPNFIKNEISYYKTIDEGLTEIAENAKKAFELSLYASNFNNPIILIDVFYAYEYNKTDNMIINSALKYTKNIEYLRYCDLKNEHIIKIVEEVFINKNELFTINHIKR